MIKIFGVILHLNREAVTVYSSEMEIHRKFINWNMVKRWKNQVK